MPSPVNGIRCKAFQDEMTWVVPQFVRLYGKDIDTLQVKLENYLDKNLPGYIDWHFQLYKEEAIIVFQMRASFCLEYAQFTLALEAAKE